MKRCARLACGVALFLAVWLALAAAALAQFPAPAPSQPQPQQQTVTPETLQSLVDTINDPTARAKLVIQLQALIAAEKGEKPQAAPKPATLLQTVSSEIDAVTDDILVAARIVVDAPRLIHWLQSQAGNESDRNFWLDVGVRLAFIFVVGFIADRIAAFLLRGAQRRMSSLSGTTHLARLFLLLFDGVLEILPAVAFAAAALIVIPMTGPDLGTREVARTFVAANLLARTVLGFAHVALLSSVAKGLYDLAGETREYLYIWVRRFTQWTVYGVALAWAGWWLGVPGAIGALVLRIVILILAILGIIFVLQNRRSVAQWLRGAGDNAGTLHVVRGRLADTWHVLAIVYVVGAFAVFALNVAGGYLFILQATFVTVVVLIAAGLLVRFVDRTSKRGFALSQETKALYPTLETRANRYLPVLNHVAGVLIYVFAILTVLQAWGVSAFGWLDTNSGRRALNTFVTIAVVLAVALVVWEMFSSAIERYLNASDEKGTPRARSARARTLLPVFRTTVMVTLGVMVGLIVMSAVGVNIAPLLAGAGVFGLAVGFASQALLKDLIIGVIILAEDTLAVGEWVDVGNGPGIVEAITMRAMRIRDVNGTLVTVPFSSVTTIRNMTRDYAYSVHDVGVLFREDPDKVIDVLKNAAAEMAADPEWKWRIVPPLDVMGLDRFTDTAQVIRVRLKTAPLQQWAVQHEFNRRIKKAFDAAGIEMPAGNQTRYLDPPPPPPGPPPASAPAPSQLGPSQPEPASPPPRPA